MAPAVSEAGDVANEDLIPAKTMPVRVSRRWSGDPLSVRGRRELAQHSQKVNLAPTRRWGQRHIATGPTYR